MNEYYINNVTNIQNTCWACLKTGEAVRTISSDEAIWYQTFTSKMQDTRNVQICTICRYLLNKCIKFAKQCTTAYEAVMNFHTNNLIQLKSSHDFGIHVLNGTCSEICMENIEIKDESYISFHEHDNILNNEEVFSNNDELFRNNEIDLTNNIKVFSHIDINTINGDTSIKDDFKFSNNDVEYPNYFESDDRLSDDDEIPLMMISQRNRKNGMLIEKSRKKKIKKTIKNGIKQESDLDTHCTNDKQNANKCSREGFSSRMVQETDEYLVIKLTKEQVLQEMKQTAASDKYQRALYKCEKCVKGFNFEEVLRGHMERHTKESGEFLCDICEQYCPSAVSLRGHMKSHTTRYKCKVCAEVRLSRQHLLEHHAITHTNSASSYTCQHCSFTTEKRTVIQRHVRKHNSDQKHTCHQCGRLFANVAALRVHTARHDKSKALLCSHCSRKFIYPSLLHKHMLAVHEQRAYYCVECDRVFKSPDNLRLHFKKAKKHRDPSSYTHKCTQCDQKFISAPSLAVHLTSAHGQPKTHSCELCPRLYSNKESLQGHIRRRHGKKAE